MAKSTFDEVRTVSDETLKAILERRLSFWMDKLDKWKIGQLKNRICELNKAIEKKKENTSAGADLAHIIGVNQ